MKPTHTFLSSSRHYEIHYSLARIEFTGSKFVNELEREGTEAELTPLFTQIDYGEAERSDRTLQTKTRARMLDSRH